MAPRTDAMQTRSGSRAVNLIAAVFVAAWALLLGAMRAVANFVRAQVRHGVQLARDFGAPTHNLRRSDAALLDLGKTFTLVGVFLGFIITVALAAAFLPTIMGQTESINENLSDENQSTGSAEADAIKPVFPIVIGIAVVVGVVALILGSISFGGRRD